MEILEIVVDVETWSHSDKVPCNNFFFVPRFKNVTFKKLKEKILFTMFKKKQNKVTKQQNYEQGKNLNISKPKTSGLFRKVL